MVILKKGRNEIVKKIIRKIFIAIGLKKPLLAYQPVFSRIDFTGLSPCSLNENSTSIFYRENNCLDI